MALYAGTKEASKKKGELFRRIKPSTLWKLVTQEEKTESIYNWDKPDEDARSQVSGFTSVTIKTEQLPVGIETDFLLIDLREPEDYDKFHIKEALNYPGTHIKRDKLIPQLHAYKNREDKIIVVYHFDEKPGMDYTMQLFEKGFDNLFLLNGGIEGFGQEIQEGLEGKDVPVFKKKEEVRKFKKQRVG